jgi:hypothetical protein
LTGVFAKGLAAGLAAALAAGFAAGFFAGFIGVACFAGFATGFFDVFEGITGLRLTKSIYKTFQTWRVKTRQTIRQAPKQWQQKIQEIGAAKSPSGFWLTANCGGEHLVCSPCGAVASSFL